MNILLTKDQAEAIGRLVRLGSSVSVETVPEDEDVVIACIDGHRTAAYVIGRDGFVGTYSEAARRQLGLPVSTAPSKGVGEYGREQ